MSRNLTVAAVLVTAAGMAAAGCGSSASTATTRSGTQAVSGTVSGPAAAASSATVPLTLAGLVSATGSITLVSSSQQQTATITTGQGDLAVTRTAGHTSTRLLSTKTCRFSVGLRAVYTVNGSKSTGKFRHATGSGDVTVLYTARVPRKPDGSCDVSVSARPVKADARVSFAAKGPLTLRQ